MTNVEDRVGQIVFTTSVGVYVPVNSSHCKKRPILVFPVLLGTFGVSIRLNNRNSLDLMRFSCLRSTSVNGVLSHSEEEASRVPKVRE